VVVNRYSSVSCETALVRVNGAVVTREKQHVINGKQVAARLRDAGLLTPVSPDSFQGAVCMRGDGLAGVKYRITIKHDPTLSNVERNVANSVDTTNVDLTDGDDVAMSVAPGTEVVHEGFLGTFVRCIGCGRVVNAAFLCRHTCIKPKSRLSSMSLRNIAVRKAVKDLPVMFHSHIPSKASTPFRVVLPQGWAQRPPRDNSKFDPDVKFMLLKMFNEGQQPDSRTKVSAPVALSRLRECGEFTREQLEKPTVNNIKSLFSRWARDFATGKSQSLSQKRRKVDAEKVEVASDLEDSASEDDEADESILRDDVVAPDVITKSGRIVKRKAHFEE
jgi:hypothetical protein